MVSSILLLSMINSDFSEKSFVMQCVKNFCQKLFIFTPNFLKWCQMIRYVVVDKAIDENILNLTNCKYYTVSEFHNSIAGNNLNIFHNNINGPETKFENLHQFLSNASTKFDIVAVTETMRSKVNEEFYTNINLEGYANFSTATNTNEGGIIYTKSPFDVTERLELNICHDLYESSGSKLKIKIVKMTIFYPMIIF